MQEYASLLIITTVVFLIFAAGLCASLILTGKNRLKRGTCGYDPNEKSDGDCEGKKTCAICSPKPDEAKEKEKDDDSI